MNQWTVIWKASDVDDYEYSYIEADGPDVVFENFEMDIVQNYLKVTAQNSNVHQASVQSIVCIIEGHVGVNFP